MGRTNEHSPFFQAGTKSIFNRQSIESGFDSQAGLMLLFLLYAVMMRVEYVRVIRQTGISGVERVRGVA
jgi:hypothetical protein